MNNLPLCRNYRDITACRLLPSPSQREKRMQKAKQSLVPSSKPLPGSAEVLLMRAGQAYRNPTSSSKGSYQTSTSRFNVAFHVPLDKPKDKEPLFVLSSGALLLESLSSFGSFPTPSFLLTRGGHHPLFLSSCFLSRELSGLDCPLFPSWSNDVMS